MIEFKYLELPQEVELEYNIALAQFMLYPPGDLKNLSWKTLGNKYKIYFTSATITVKTLLENKHVKESVYNIDGKKIAERITLDGRKNGYNRIWNENGVLIIDQLYKDNQIDGLQTRYYETGELKEKMFVENGSYQYVEKYGKNGTLKRTIYPKGFEESENTV